MSVKQDFSLSECSAELVQRAFTATHELGMRKALAGGRLLFLGGLVGIVGVLVTQAGRAARVLALLQQVAQFRAVQGAPPHAPVEVVKGFALEESTHGRHVQGQTKGGR